MSLLRIIGGFVLVTVGIIGVILPIMPGWIFLIPGLVTLSEHFDWAKRLIKEFDIRTPSSTTPARNLSGGNQQKIIVAREMATSPRVLLAAQPTRGVDIGAIEFIHRRLVTERDGGAGILLASAAES